MKKKKALAAGCIGNLPCKIKSNGRQQHLIGIDRHSRLILVPNSGRDSPRLLTLQRD